MPSAEDLPLEFITAYNALIDRLCKANSHTDLFWASDIASKNRFSSQLPDIAEAMFLNALPASIKIEDKSVKRKLGIFVYAWQSFWRMRYAQKTLKSPVKPMKTLVRTFAYNHSFDDNGFKDVFLGELTLRLREQGAVTVVAVLGDYKKCVDLMARDPRPVYPLEYFLTGKDILKSLWQVLSTPFKVPDQLMLGGRDVSAVTRQVVHASFKGVQWHQWVQYPVYQRLAGEFQPSHVVMTYENYPWERLLLLAMRRHHPAAKITGIQHTVVPQAFLNYFISKSEKENGLIPDAVWTTGKTTRQMIEQYSDALPEQLNAGCALRFASLVNAPLIKRQAQGQILVALEASLKTRPMIEAVIGLAQGMPAKQFVIRTHPLLPWNQIEKQWGMSLPANVVISRQSLRDDLNRAQAVIYYSTTVSLEALAQGIPVIHFNLGGLLSFDPAQACPALKWTVKDQGQLQIALRVIDEMDPVVFAQEQAKARLLMNDYFHAVTPQILAQIAFEK